MESSNVFIKSNLKKIRAKIDSAAKKSGRLPKDITLVAVTKNKSIADIRVAIENGVRIIGENKVQEAKQKFTQLGPTVKWHMLGHLQTNKAKSAAIMFDMVQSVDSDRLVDVLDKTARQLDKKLEVLVEVNIAGEESKFGVKLSDTQALVEYVANKPNLKLRGLMAMAPYVTDSELARPFFREISDVFYNLKNKVLNNNNFNILSLGMTNDFEVAIEEGANLVRIGTGIFNESD